MSYAPGSKVYSVNRQGRVHEWAVTRVTPKLVYLSENGQRPWQTERIDGADGAVGHVKYVGTFYLTEQQARAGTAQRLRGEAAEHRRQADELDADASLLEGGAS